MSKNRPQVPSIYDITKYLKNDNFLSIYFLCGEDFYSIDKAVKLIQKSVEHLIASDFDREVISAEKKQSINSVIDIASAFPFGGEKKILVLKNFENISDKKAFENYAKNPAEHTILVISYYSKVNDFSKEPFNSLLKKNYLFEAKELRGEEWVNWLVRLAEREGIKLKHQHAKTIIDIVGEDKALLENQIAKFSNFLNEGESITDEVINKLASATKENNIFQLLDELGKRNKSGALDISFNLLSNGIEPVFILSMLTKYITTISHIFDLTKRKVSDNEGAKSAGVSYYYYLNCKKARYFLSKDRLLNASRALLDADLSIKTSNADKYTVLTILISEMLQ
ncbi:MAG: DNA polymerase III subunit delta [Ignavibacteria bacterium]|jgi:DNA polymerase-3 subunit delta